MDRRKNCKSQEAGRRFFRCTFLRRDILPLMDLKAWRGANIQRRRVFAFATLMPFRFAAL